MSESIVVMDVWAEWCAPCLRFAPIFEKVGEEMADKATFIKVNADENRELVAQYGIRSIPTLLILKDGEVVRSVVGAMGEETLRDIVTEAL